MAGIWKTLPDTPLDDIMLANAAWPEFQKRHKHAINTTIGVLVDPDSGNIWRPKIVSKLLEKTQKSIDSDTLYGYQKQAGNTGFLRSLADHIFSNAPEDLLAFQTLGGTGALSLTRDTLIALLPTQKDKTIPFILDGGWPNHLAIFNDPFKVFTYTHLDENGLYNHQAALHALQHAPASPVVLLQVCGYNDDGADRTTKQWDEILKAAKSKKATIILDAAYLGLAKGFSQDCYPLQQSLKLGLLTFVCVSTSKNMGLYNERLGALYVAHSSKQLGVKQSQNLDQTIARIVRRTISSAPQHVALAAHAVLQKDSYFKELEELRASLMANRQQFADIVGDKIPNIASGAGLFTKLLPGGFSNAQMDFLESEGVLALPNSRINLGGLRTKDVKRVASVVREALD